MAGADKNVALVTPWFSDDETNGSEMLSSQLVRELFAPEIRVDVLTTCARAFSGNWSENYYAPGVSHRENVTVRRFAVRERDADAFERANQFLLSQPVEFLKEHRRCIPDQVAADFCRENIQSPALLRYLSDWGRAYRAVIFTPYLYGPALQGVRAVASRAFLQPCLHDEPYAYLPQVAALFEDARGLLFNSRAEFELARRLYGPQVEKKSAVVGHWVAAPQRTIIHDRVVPRERFVFYLGRVCESKNVNLIIKAFGDYRRYNPRSRLKFVIAGEGDAGDAGSDVRVLGRIGERQKAALLQSCAALLQPSVNESFSRSVMEAWSYAKPVAVNAQCEPTSAAVRECGGGWTASSPNEWISILAAIERAPSRLLREIGERGRMHYLQFGTPQRVLQRYREALGLDGVPAAQALA